jgi:GxxExxY protein
MNADERRLDEITDKVIGCAFVVSNVLGAGFVEKVYENALTHELRSVGLAVAQQYGVAVRYKGILVGEYVADLLVANEVVVEIKAVRALDDVHNAQCMNYLKATGLPGLLIDQLRQTAS